jgi:hypothetical protein
MVGEKSNRLRASTQRVLEVRREADRRAVFWTENLLTLVASVDLSISPKLTY